MAWRRRGFDSLQVHQLQQYPLKLMWGDGSAPSHER